MRLGVDVVYQSMGVRIASARSMLQQAVERGGGHPLYKHDTGVTEVVRAGRKSGVAAREGAQQA